MPTLPARGHLSVCLSVLSVHFGILSVKRVLLSVYSAFLSVNHPNRKDPEFSIRGLFFELLMCNRELQSFFNFR